MSAEPAEFRLSAQSKLIILTAVLASLLEIIDTSIVNVAIPTMMGNLGVTIEDISWVVTGYIIANAIVLPLSAWLGSRIGRRKYYVGCILLFTAASVACGFAPNLWTLVIFRVIQGFAGGALLPTSQTLIQEQFPPERAGMANAIYGMSVMIGPTLGPTLGGYLTDHFGWRSIFNINLPLGLIAAMMALNNVSEPTHRRAINGAKAAPKPIDAIGLGLLMAGVGCLQYVLERGEADDWFSSKAIVLCSIIAAVSIPFFIWWELRVDNPIVNVRLFTDPVVRNGTALMANLGFMLYGMVFILPIFAATVLHYDATDTGMLFIPGALLTASTMPFVGRLLKTVDPRRLIFFGMATIIVCLFMMTNFNSRTTEAEIFRSLLVRGLAMGFLFVPINTVVLGQFRGESLGQVAGLMNLFRQLGGSVGVALIGTLLTKNNQQNYIDLASHVSLLEPAGRLALDGGEASMAHKMVEMVGLNGVHPAALRMVQMRMQAQVFLMSFNQMLWWILLIFSFGFIPLFTMQIKRKIAGPVTADH